MMMRGLGGNGGKGGGWRWLLRDRAEWKREIGELGRWRNGEGMGTGNDEIGLWEGIELNGVGKEKGRGLGIMELDYRRGIEWIDEEFGKCEKYTEEFTSSGELRDEN